MSIFDRTALREMLRVTCSILKNNFMYDEEYLSQFLKDFTAILGEELHYFELWADTEILDKIYRDRVARLYFTIYFVSAHLRDFFIENLHFSEQEIYAFESILPKYSGDKTNENQQKHSRTHYREFFK